MRVVVSTKISSIKLPDLEQMASMNSDNKLPSKRQEIVLNHQQLIRGLNVGETLREEGLHGKGPSSSWLYGGVVHATIEPCSLWSLHEF